LAKTHQSTNLFKHHLFPSEREVESSPWQTFHYTTNDTVRFYSSCEWLFLGLELTHVEVKTNDTGNKTAVLVSSKITRSLEQVNKTSLSSLFWSNLW